MPGRAAGARPDITFFIELDFPSVADTERQWKFNEILGLGIEAIQRVIAGAADPHHAIGGDIEGIRNLIQVIRQGIGRPLLGIRVELAEDSGAEPRNPNHSIRRNMKTPWPTEGRVPLSDVTVGSFRIDAPDAVSVEFGVPDHAIDW